MHISHAPEYQEFLDQYLRKNVPVILPPALVEGWPALEQWQDFFWDVLEADYGEHIVPVVTDDRRDMRLREAVTAIRQRSRPVYIKDWHIIRDLLRAGDHASEIQLPYWTPAIFADDCALPLTGMNNVTPTAKGDYPFGPDCWLRENAGEYAADDFRFCYAGTACSSTPLHRDGTCMLTD